MLFLLYVFDFFTAYWPGKISWQFRLVANASMPNFYCSVDNTDCPINEPHLIRPKWFFPKFNGPGAQYDIGVCVHRGNIV